MNWSTTDLAYLAGLIDGEGCFMPRQSGHITLSMTNQRTVEWLLKFGGKVYEHTPGGEGKNRKRQWHWNLHKKTEVRSLLDAVLPFLNTRYMEAEALSKLLGHSENKPTPTFGQQGEEWDRWRLDRDAYQQRVRDLRNARHVLAIDPGERAGWARAAVTEDNRLLVLDHGIASLKDMALAVYQGAWRYDTIIYETFILTARGGKTMVGSDLQTAQLVGMCRLAAWLNPRVQLVPQHPGAMRSADKSMRSHPSGAAMQKIIDKLPKSHDESHDGSALRHAWTYFFERFV